MTISRPNITVRPLALAAAVLAAAACASGPRSSAEQAQLETRAATTLAAMRTQDPALQPLLDAAHAYAVFPEVGKGGLIAGGASGVGVLYEQGRPTGYVRLTEASLGAQAGGQTFSQLVVFRDAFAVQRLKAGELTLGANASAVALRAGVAANATFEDGIAVFVVPRGGFMAELAISGQRLQFQPRG